MVSWLCFGMVQTQVRKIEEPNRCSCHLKQVSGSIRANIQPQKNPNPSSNQQREMTQKANLFKGQAKKKSIPPNRHGKAPVTRKGKRFVKPSKVTKDMDADREVSKFINHCNEIKAATLAQKDGGQLGIIKSPPEPASGANK